MHAFAKYNFEFVVVPLISSGYISKSDFDQGFNHLLKDYGVTEESYLSTPELLDVCTPFDILRYVLPERYISSDFSDMEDEDDFKNVISLYQKATQDEWQIKDIQFEKNSVLLKSIMGDIQLAFDLEFEEALRRCIDDQVEESSFLEWTNGDCLNSVWLPLVLKEAIEQRLNSLHSRAAERLRRFKPGDRVSHKMIGQGRVVSFDPTLNGDMIGIKFDDGEISKFVDDTGEFIKII
jgi:hypothetical protein